MKYPLIPFNDIPAEGEGTKLVDFFGRQIHVYTSNGKPRAVMNVCMHFGGPLDYKDCKFVCQWHNAEFASDTGQRIEGPAPSNSRLMFLSTRIEDNILNYVWGE
jgi:nitrite reductase/ring-hydroxylating ferredoxin subunit